MPVNEGSAMLASAGATIYAIWLAVGTRSPMREWANVNPTSAFAIVIGAGLLAYYLGGLAHPGDGWHFYPP